MNSYVRFAEPESRGGDVPVATMVVIDCSPSMEEADWHPSRLAGAKEAASHLIDEKCRRFPGDLVGVVRYGGFATLVHRPVPVGVNNRSLVSALNAISTIPSTNLQRGLRRAGEALGVHSTGGSPPTVFHSLKRLLLGEDDFRRLPSVYIKHIICLSDGESNSGDADEEAATLKVQGVLIDTIGVAARNQVNEVELKTVASRDQHGNPRYRFIGDKEELVREFVRLAGHIRVMGK